MTSFSSDWRARSIAFSPLVVSRLVQGSLGEAFAATRSPGNVRLELYLRVVKACGDRMTVERRSLRPLPLEPGDRLALVCRHRGEPVSSALDPLYEGPAYLAPDGLDAEHVVEDHTN